MDRRVILKVEEVWYAKPKHRPRVLFVSKYHSNKFLVIWGLNSMFYSKMLAVKKMSFYTHYDTYKLMVIQTL